MKDTITKHHYRITSLRLVGVLSPYIQHYSLVLEKVTVTSTAGQRVL